MWIFTKVLLQALEYIDYRASAFPRSLSARVTRAGSEGGAATAIVGTETFRFFAVSVLVQVLDHRFIKRVWFRFRLFENVKNSVSPEISVFDIWWFFGSRTGLFSVRFQPFVTRTIVQLNIKNENETNSLRKIRYFSFPNMKSCSTSGYLNLSWKPPVPVWSRFPIF